MKSVLFLVLASCSATATSHVPTTPTPTPPVPVLGKPLAGPFATLDAYCATVPDRCSVRDTPIPEVDNGPVDDAGILYVSVEPNDTVFGCAIALHTAAGWFVTAPSEDACRNPSYIDLLDVRTSTDGTVLTFELDVNWHTKHASLDPGNDDEASYTLTTFCNVDPLVCAPAFTSRCEINAPASNCSEGAYEASWALDGATLRLTSPSPHPSVPNGTHRLF